MTHDDGRHSVLFYIIENLLPPDVGGGGLALVREIYSWTFM